MLWSNIWDSQSPWLLSCLNDILFSARSVGNTYQKLRESQHLERFFFFFSFFLGVLGKHHVTILRAPDSKPFSSEEVKDVCSRVLCSRHSVPVGNHLVLSYFINKGYVSLAHVFWKTLSSDNINLIYSGRFQKSQVVYSNMFGFLNPSREK